MIGVVMFSKKNGKKVDYKKVAEELAVENAKLNESLLRERADAENVRRRAENDRISMSSYYKAGVVKELLSFIDNLDRALAHIPPETRDSQLETVKNWLKGLEAARKQLQDILNKIGVEKIKTVGEPFNPELHEAVIMEEGDGNQEVVSEELQSGYILGDEVIRHAMVRVKNQ